MINKIWMVLGIALTLTTTAAQASFYTPSWAGEENAVNLNWTFDAETELSVANPFGSADATINPADIDDPYGHFESMAFTGETHTGMWYISDSIDIAADASDVDWSNSEVIVQVVYFQLGWGYDNSTTTQRPTITVEGAELQGESVSVLEELAPNNAWLLYTTHWYAEPSLSFLNISVDAGVQDSMIDQIVVDAVSLPEPASLLMLLSGVSIAVARRSR